MTLLEHSKQLSACIEKRGQKLKRASLFVKIALVALFSAVAGIAQFMDFAASGPSISQVIGITASLVVAVGAIFVVFTDDDASEAIALAQKATEQAREIEAEFQIVDELEADVGRLIELFQSVNVMRGVIETSTAFPTVSHVKVIEALLEVTSRSLSIAMDFAQEDLWTIGIYQAQPDPDDPTRVVLKCVAQKRAIACATEATRIWKEGTGIMGVCYSSGDEIVVPDLWSPGTNAVFSTSANERRNYDNERYRSMAAVPVNVTGMERPWGVVTATTDRVGHFSPIHENGIRPDEAVRALAGMCALAVAVRRVSEQ